MPITHEDGGAVRFENGKLGTAVITLDAAGDVAAGGGGGGDASAANQTTELARLGILTETAPADDTASSGLNGRLQRIAQQITSLIALLPPDIGPQVAAASLSITQASDESWGVTAATQVKSDTNTPTDVGYGAGDLSMPVAPEQIVSQTGTPFLVADTTSNTQILAANTARTRAIFTNTSSAVCYLLLGTGTPSATVFTARLAQYDAYIEEGEGVYVGICSAAWASDPGDGSLVGVEYEG